MSSAMTPRDRVVQAAPLAALLDRLEKRVEWFRDEIRAGANYQHMDARRQELQFIKALLVDASSDATPPAPSPLADEELRAIWRAACLARDQVEPEPTIADSLLAAMRAISADGYTRGAAAERARCVAALRALASHEHGVALDAVAPLHIRQRATQLSAGYELAADALEKVAADGGEVTNADG